MGQPTFFVEDDALTARSAEVPAAQWGTGGDWAGSCAPGIGIAVGEGSVAPERPEAWTLEDQYEEARTPQVSSVIGADGFVDRAVVTDWSNSGGLALYGDDDPVRYGDPTTDGQVTPDGDATLATIAAGWV